QAQEVEVDGAQVQVEDGAVRAGHGRGAQGERGREGLAGDGAHGGQRPGGGGPDDVGDVGRQGGRGGRAPPARGRPPPPGPRRPGKTSPSDPPGSPRPGGRTTPRRSRRPCGWRANSTTPADSWQILQTGDGAHPGQRRTFSRGAITADRPETAGN